MCSPQPSQPSAGQAVCLQAGRQPDLLVGVVVNISLGSVPPVIASLWEVLGEWNSMSEINVLAVAESAFVLPQTRAGI